ncbi:TetR family transcriptional regulator [Ideonella sp. DXS29W]|uniref:TetR family transcriptional regulator n=1 Tax=Ideonella lacteola TaxID=2984193 RepID=A0ABU9BJ10_9BURK
MMAAARRGARAAKDTLAEAAPDRRQAILLAAEKLFGLRGYHAVSIRDIAGEAGVPLALVGYYFGAKHELYHAIFESWQGSIDERVAALKAAASDLKAPDALERVLCAWVVPLVELSRHPTGQYYALMAARDLMSPTPESERAQEEFFNPMAHAYIDTLQQIFPRATRGQVAWCYQFMLGAVLHYLTDVRVETLSRGENRATDDHGQQALLRFLAAGFRGALKSG